jgi:hypothetical protein
MSAKKTSPKKEKSRNVKAASESKAGPSLPGVVVITSPQARADVPAILVDKGGPLGLISAMGFIRGGEVTRVRGVVLGANQRIPAKAPAHSISAKLISGRDGEQPLNTFFEFALEPKDEIDRRLPVHQIGINNRLVVWAEFKRFQRSVIANVCLQFEALRKPRFGNKDGHSVSFPSRGALDPAGNPFLFKAPLARLASGDYVLEKCIISTVSGSSGITGVKAKVYTNKPSATELKSPSLPFLEKTFSSPRTSYTFDSSTERVPGAAIGKSNYLCVWAKYAADPNYKLQEDGEIQFEGY